MPISSEDNTQEQTCYFRRQNRKYCMFGITPASYNKKVIMDL